MLAKYGFQSMVRDYLIVPASSTFASIIQGLGFFQSQTSRPPETVIPLTKPLCIIPDPEDVALVVHRAAAMVHDGDETLEQLLHRNVTDLAANLKTLGGEIMLFGQIEALWPWVLAEQLGSAHRLVQDLEGGAVSRKNDHTFTPIKWLRGRTVKQQGAKFQRSVQTLLTETITHRQHHRQQLRGQAASLINCMRLSSCAIVHNLTTQTTLPSDADVTGLLKVRGVWATLSVVCQASNQAAVSRHGRLVAVNEEIGRLRHLRSRTAAVMRREGENLSLVEDDLVGILKEFMRGVRTAYFASELDEAIELAARRA